MLGRAAKTAGKSVSLWKGERTPRNGKGSTFNHCIVRSYCVEGDKRGNKGREERKEGKEEREDRKSKEDREGR